MENIDTKALESLFETEVSEIQDQAVLYFQRFIKERGLVLTGDLLEHFKKSVVVVAADLYAEIKISFRFSGRYLDLKTMTYQGGKPDPDGALIQGMKAFIESVGIQKFNGIPGYYGSASLPSNTAALNRLAYTLAYARMNKGTIRRRGEGWYNKGRSFLVRDVRRTLQSKIAVLILKEVASNMNDTMDG